MNRRSMVWSSGVRLARPVRRATRRIVGVHEPQVVETFQAETDRRLADLERGLAELGQRLDAVAARVETVVVLPPPPIDLTSGERLDAITEELLAQRRALASLQTLVRQTGTVDVDAD